ncbi:Gp49 family protein [Mesorhizobium sp. M7A.F.Ca.CA.002.12.1.1]|uniref:Gp49 family protein n=1 Tax=Mesorhizobium sp. M7A.F.Ca.CA.002.12.1.1 TaxID=2496735 RepID=UPI0019D0D26E|nr:Gp49 family protein [Mesorhizobium sp. M7A.F.Ca.CA.002.12.1.1]
MNMRVTEKELIEKATGERVTLDAVEAAIVSEHYFTASDGVIGETYMRGEIGHRGYQPEDLNLLTICVLRLWNGFTVLGQSACADPKNFDKDIGRRLAKSDAVGKMWALMGYELKSRMARDERLVGGASVEPRPDCRTYIGTKVVNARPMNRRDYNDLRSWTVPVNENPADEGYLVEYTDRVENPPHVPGFKGYVSWSPKEVFERAYRPVRAAEAKPAAASAEGSGEASIWQDLVRAGKFIDAIKEYRALNRTTLKDSKDAVEAWRAKNQETWLDRAKAELAELTARYDKLEIFLRTDASARLPTADRKDLYVQVNHMEGYKHALAKRVARANSIAAADYERVLQQQAQQFQNRDAG